MNLANICTCVTTTTIKIQTLSITFKSSLMFNHHQFPTSLAPGNYQFASCLYKLVLPLPEFHLNGILQHVLFLCLLLLLNIFLKFIHIIVCISNLFLFIAERYCTVQIYHNLCSYSPVSRYLDCSQFGVILNLDDMNIMYKSFVGIVFLVLK